jgi:hypothetical protein
MNTSFATWIPGDVVDLNGTPAVRELTRQHSLPNLIWDIVTRLRDHYTAAYTRVTLKVQLVVISCQAPGKLLTPSAKV